MIIPIDSLDDPRLDDYVRLNDVKLRKKLESENGLYIAESMKVIMRAIQCGHTPRSFMTTPAWLEELSQWVELATGEGDGGEVPIFMASEEVLSGIIGYHLHRSALAAMNRPPLPCPEDLMRLDAPGPRRIVILEGIVDHTNVGAIFRSCAALGVDCVLVTPNCADPLYRRSIRVSMGTVFQVPWTRCPALPEFLPTLHRAGVHTAALALTDDSISLDEFSALDIVRDPHSRIATIYGTEGDGLAHASIKAAEYTVKIPMAGGVDSLNVAASSALTCWELRPRG